MKKKKTSFSFYFLLFSLNYGAEFLSAIADRYLDNPYHNYKHGCDVCHTVYRLVRLSGLEAVFTGVEFFSLLVAAVAHDVGHLGVNNAFLVKSRHELAVRYEDQSPLEKMHCSVLMEVGSVMYMV